MGKGIRVGIVLCVLVLAGALFAQEAGQKREFNPLYEPLSYVQRASYDNFKNIKLLHTAIMNFGGGEAEFDKLVDEYAEASALYFRESLVESANTFARNEKNILATALKLAQRYKTDSEAVHTDVIKFHVRNNVKLSLNGKRPDPTAELLLSNANFGIKRANDYMARSRPVEAIYYFRRAKENCFKYYEVTKQPLPEKYKRDVVDNQNKVYTAKEKEK
jgi:hypothetical protein